MAHIEKCTQILATMGPTLQSVEDVVRMLELGVHQFRIHMGLRTRDFCGYYRNALTAAAQLFRKLDILLDLPSTRPRVSGVEAHDFKPGEYCCMVDASDTRLQSYAANTALHRHAVDIALRRPATNTAPHRPVTDIPLSNLSDIIRYIRPGEHIMFRDGHVVFEVRENHGESLSVECIRADLPIKSGASASFPESGLSFQPLDETDISYLKKMRAEGMCPDKAAVSFASTPEQLEQVRSALQDIWPENSIQIISKIESREGLKNIDALLGSSDGMMIARGDLLLCIRPAELPGIQSALAKKCRAAGKYLIIATEFFERYAESGVVSRAELSDVALAVRQGADALMLARETGNSRYSLGCVRLIQEIIQNESNPRLGSLYWQEGG